MAASSRAEAVLGHEAVTHHAVQRYCERVLGVMLPPEEQRRYGPVGLAEAYCKAAGKTATQICEAILTPGVVAMCRLSRTVPQDRSEQFSVKSPAFIVRVRNGLVVTIQRNEREYRPKLKVYTRKQLRRAMIASRFESRAKRRADLE